MLTDTLGISWVHRESFTERNEMTGPDYGVKLAALKEKIGVEINSRFGSHWGKTLQEMRNIK